MSFTPASARVLTRLSATVGMVCSFPFESRPAVYPTCSISAVSWVQLGGHVFSGRKPSSRAGLFAMRQKSVWHQLSLDSRKQAMRSGAHLIDGEIRILDISVVCF